MRKKYVNTFQKKLFFLIRENILSQIRIAPPIIVRKFLLLGGTSLLMTSKRVFFQCSAVFPSIKVNELSKLFDGCRVLTGNGTLLARGLRDTYNTKPLSDVSCYTPPV